MMLERDLGGVLDLRVACRRARRASPAAAIAEAEPTSPWQPTSAPEIEALCLMMPPIAAAVSRNVADARAVGADAVVEVVAEHRRDDAGGAVGRRGDDAAAGGVLLVDRHGVDRRASP